MSFDIFASAAHCFTRTASRTAARHFALAVGFAAFAAWIVASGHTAEAQSIAVHWNSYYGGQGAPAANVPADTADGILVPGGYNANWNNLSAGYYQSLGAGANGLNINLMDSAGNTTTAAVTTVTNGNYGTYWYDGSYTSTNNLLNGPWGQAGNAIPNVITGIPYANYEIIGYTNPPFGPGGEYTVWLDSSPATSSSADPAVAGSQYYFTPDSGNGNGIGVGGNFDLMTSQNVAAPTAANTVVWSNLSGSSQTIWTDSAPNNGQGNYGFTGFEIVNTALSVGTVWTGTAGDTLWTTGTNWAGNAVPATDTSVTFGNSGATSVVDLGASGQKVNGLYFIGTVNTTIQSVTPGGQSLTLDNGTGMSAATSAAVPVVSYGGTDRINTPVILNSNAAIAVDALTTSISGAISDGTHGPASLAVSGGGVLILSANNSYSGGTTVTGTLRVSNTSGSATGSGPVAVNSGGILGGSGTIIGNVTVSGAGSGQLSPQIASGTSYATLNITGNLTLDNNSVLGFNFGAPGSSTASPGASDSVSATGILSLNGITTVNITSQSGFGGGVYQILSAPTITGFNAGSFAVGTHTGTAANFSYSFTDTGTAIDLIALTPGVALTWTGAVANGSGGANWDTTTMNWNGGQLYFDGNPSAFQAGDSVVFATGAATGNINVSGNFSPAAVSITATDQSFVFSGAGSIGGTGLVTVNTPGQSVTLSTANTYSGGTLLQAGTLRINNAGSGGTSSAIGIGTFVIDGGTTIDNTSGGPITLSTNNPLNINGSFTFTGTNSLNLGTGAATMSGSPTITVNANTLTIGGSIGGSGGITKLGNGALALGGAASTFGGGINFYAGELDINGAAALGTGTLTIGQQYTQTGLIIDNTSGSPVTLTTSPAETWGVNNPGFTFRGSNNLNLGNGTITQSGTMSIGVLGSTLTQTGSYMGTGSALFVFGAGTLNFQTSTPFSEGTTAGYAPALAIGQQNFGNQVTGINETLYVGSGGNVSFSGPALIADNTTVPTSIQVYENGSLTLDNTTTNENYRLSGGAGVSPQPIFLNGGGLRIVGNTILGTNTLESSGVLTVGEQGGAYGANSGGSSITLVSPTNNVTFTGASLTYNGGELVINGTGLGTSASSAPGTSNVFFTTVPNMTTGGATTNAATTDPGGTNTLLPILQYAIGNNTAAGGGYGLVTYDSTYGIRLLSPGEYATGLTDGTNAPTTNYSQSSSLAVTAGITVNSITLVGGTQSNPTVISGTGTLNSDSNVYAANGGYSTISVNGLSGSQIFDVMGSSTVLTVSSNITGQFRNMVVNGEGTLIYTGTNSVNNGGLQIDGGTFKAGSNSWASPNWGGFELAGGATLDLNGFSSTIGAYNNGFDGSGTITNSGAPASLVLAGDQNVNAPFVGNITGGAGLTLVKTSPYPMELGGSASTFTGGIIVNGGILQLDSAGSSGGAGNAITVNSSPLDEGVIGIGYNVANQAALYITSGSSGVLGINGYGMAIPNQGGATAFTSNLNMATLGNGSMFLGVDDIPGQYNNGLPSNKGIYSGTSLGAGAGGTYRLGGGGGFLTITNNVLTAGNNLVVGQVGGQININGLWSSYGVMNGQGDVKFDVPQTAFNGSITVNGGTFDPGNGMQATSLELSIPASTGQAIGTGTTRVTLNGGMLQLDPPNTSTPNTTASFGTLTAIGGPAQLATGESPYSNSAGSVVTFANIVRDNNSALYVGVGNNSVQQGPLYNNGADTLLGLGGTQFLVSNSSGNPNTAISNFIPNGGTNGMVTYGGAPAPWIIANNQHDGGEFLAYTPNGFTPTIYTYQGVANGFVDGVNTFMSGAASTDIVQFEPGTPVAAGDVNDTSLSGSATIYALSVFFGTGGRNPTISSTGGATLTITSGAISQNIQNGGVTFGDPTGVNYLNLNFPVEAVIYDGAYNGQGNINFYNLVTAPSLTKIGPGNLSLDNAAANAGSPNPITGPVTIDSGTIVTGQNGADEYSLGSGAGSNVVVLNGGEWQVNGNGANASIAHNINVGPAGGIFALNNNSQTYSGSISDLVSPDGTKAGPLTLITSGGNTLTLSNTSALANLWSGGTEILGTGTVRVPNGVNFGSGPVEVTPGTLILQGTGPSTSFDSGTGAGNNLSPTADLTVDAGGTADFQGAAPYIGSLDGAGSVVLGNTTTPAATTLTVGGNNASTSFYGTISDLSATNAAAVGSLVKIGAGTFTLTGGNTYTGATNVNNGTLRVNGSLRGTGAVTIGDPVNSGGTPVLTGTGRVAGAVTVLGTSSPSAGAVAGASGSTLTLAGGVTLTNGSNSNFALTAAGVNNLNALIATSGGVGGNSLVFDSPTSTALINLSGTAAIGTYELYSYTGTAPAGAFAFGTNSITTPELSYSISLANADQVDLVIISANTITWTGTSSTWNTSPSNTNWATINTTPTATSYTDGGNVIFGDTNTISPASALSSPQTVNISGTVNPGSIDFQNNATQYTVNGRIGGSGKLSLDGSQSVTLTGANSTYSGGTFINQGTLRLGASSSGGSGPAVTSGPVGTGAVTVGATTSSTNSASLYLSTGASTLGNNIIVASGSSGTMTLGGQNTSGIDTFSGSITLGSGSAGQNLTISEPSGGELDLTGGILAGPTAAGITVNGGLVKLTNGTSTISGTTTVSTGTLRVTNTSGSATGTGPVNVASGAVLGGGAGGTTGAIGGLVTISGGGHLAPNGFTGTSSPGTATNLTFNGGLTLSNGSNLDYILGTSGDLVTLGGTGHTLTLGTGVALNITQAAGFGLGTYDLINYGTNTVAAGSDANLSTWTDPTHGAFQQPTFTDTGSQIDLTLTQITASAAWDFAGSGNWNDITKWSPLGTYPNGAGQTATFGGLVSSPASITITNNINPTLGTMTFANSSVSYTVSGGTVTMNNNNTGAAVNVNAGSHFIASNLALTDTSGTTFTVANSSSLSVSGGITNSSGAGTTFTNNGTLALSGGFANGGQLATFNGAGNSTVSTTGISGLGGLTYGGTGTLTLSASNGYTGATQVSSGTLRLTGALASATVNVGGTSASEVNTNTMTPAGGTPSLAGGGTIAGSVEVFGNTGGSSPGHLAPSGFNGSSATVMNIAGNLTLDAGAVLDFNLSNTPDSSATSGPVTPGGSNDFIAVGGSLSLNGGKLYINDPHGLMAGTYVLVDYVSGSPSATGWTPVLTVPAAGYSLNFSTDSIPNGFSAQQFDLIVTTGSGSATWTSTGAGLNPSDYGTGSNWTPGTVPNGAGQTATFGAGAQSTVSINSSYTLGQLNFNNGGNSGAPAGYLLLGNGNLTLNNSGSGASVNVSSGSLAPELGANVTLTLADSSLTTTFNIASGSSLVVGGAIGQSGSGQRVVLAGGGTLELESPNTYSGSTTINSGIFQVDSGASIAHTSSVSIAAGGTLQLVGTTGALPSTANISTHGTGSAGDGALVLIGAATETVGTISGDTHQITDGSQQVTVYSGNTTVGDGSNSASLTATQILGNTLTINSNSTVTIAPSGSGIPTDAQGTEAVSGAALAAGSSAADSDSSSDSSSDPFTAIEAAIDSGSISSAKGQQLENRIAAIERLATTDPGLDVSLLEDRVLAALPSNSVWSSSGTSPLLDSGSGLLAVDNSSTGSSSGSTLGGSAAFAPAAAFGGSPAAVPEPSTLLLAALGGIGILIVLRRRMVYCEQ